MDGEPFWGGPPKIADRIARDARLQRRLEVARAWGVAPPTFDGKPTITRHYDADGNLTGWTETESPWDDLARAEAEGLHEAEKHLICPKCGNLREVCSDPTRVWYPQRSTCYSSAMHAVAERRWDARLKGDAGWPLILTPEPRDGTHIWMASADLTPEDKFI